MCVCVCVCVCVGVCAGVSGPVPLSSLGVFSATSHVVPGSSSLNPPSVGSLLSASDNLPARLTLLNMSQLMNSSFHMTQMSPKK